jgi:predicted MFS family arabinose efflux permease
MSSLAVYCSAQGLSSIGEWMQRAGLGWLAWDLTHSPGWVGALALTEVLMPLWVTPLGGALADRQSPYRILFVTQVLLMVHALALCAYAAMDHAGIVGLFVLALAGSGLNALNTPARLTVMNQIAPEGRLAQGIAINSIMFNVARAVGPALGGVIMASGHVFPVFALNAGSYLFMLAAIVHLRPWMDRPGSARKGGLGADVVEGLRYIGGAPAVAVVFALAAVVSLLARPFTELIPAIAGQVFHAGPQGLSGLMTAQGVGALFGAGIMLRRHKVRRLLVITFAAGLLMSLAVVGLAAAPSLSLAFAIMAVAGFFHTACNVGMQSLTQLMAKEAYRGRAMALYGMVFRSGPAASGFLIGLAADRWSLRALLMGGAVLGALLIVATAVRARRVYASVQDPA